MLIAKKLGENWGAFTDFLKNRFKGVSTGVAVLDKAIRGLPGVTVIGGPPGATKSVLGLQIANHYAEYHGPVYFFDLENGYYKTEQRLLCQRLGVSETELMAMELKKDVELEEMKRVLGKLPFTYVVAGNFLDLQEALDVHIEAGKRPLLVIDSVQALRHEQAEDIRLSVDSWMKDIDMYKVANEGKFKAILITEKNTFDERSLELGSNKESKTIDYKGEVIISLMADRSDPKMIMCKVSKNRDGAKANVFYLKQAFSQLDPPPEEGPNQSFCYKLITPEEVNL